MHDRNAVIKLLLLGLVAALLLLLPTLIAEATNDVNTAAQSNGTVVDLTATWTEYGNISNFVTGLGNSTISISVNTANNYSQARSYLRIKKDGMVLESINLSQSYIPETVTFIVTTAETVGTHYYSWESYCTSGRKCQIYNRTFSVMYLNTGSFGSGSGSGNASYPINLSNSSQATQILPGTNITVEYLTNGSVRIASSGVAVTAHDINGTEHTGSLSRSRIVNQVGIDDSQNQTATTLQGNDTTHNAKFDYVNGTFLYNSTYNGNFPNATVAANLGNWNATNNASIQINITQVNSLRAEQDTQNSSITNIESVNINQNTTDTQLQSGINFANTTNDQQASAITSINNSILIHDAKIDAQNVTNNLKVNKSGDSLTGDFDLNSNNFTEVFEIFDPTGKYYLKNNSVFAGVNVTVTQNANGTISIGSTGTSETDPIAMAQGFITNLTAQITRTQVTSQEGVDTGQNSTHTNLANYLNNTFPGSSFITTLGTIATGIWQGTKIAGAYLVDADRWNAVLTSHNNTDLTHDAKFDAQNVTNNLKVNKTELNSTIQINVTQVNGLRGEQDAQNTSFQNSSFGIVLTNGSNAISTGYYDAILEIPASGTITSLSVRGRFTGAINLSLMYNATSVPVYPGDVVASINVTSGSSASSTGLSIVVVQNGNLMPYVYANGGAVNKTNLRGILRRS